MPYSKDKGMMGPLMQQPNQKYYIKKCLHWKFQLSAEDTIYSLNLFLYTWKYMKVVFRSDGKDWMKLSDPVVCTSN